MQDGGPNNEHRNDEHVGDDDDDDYSADPLASLLVICLSLLSTQKAPPLYAAGVLWQICSVTRPYVA